MCEKTWNAVKLNISVLYEGIICTKCTKVYECPEINICGHSLCKICWKNQKCCPTCTSKLTNPKPNRSLAVRAVHLKKFVEAGVAAIGISELSKETSSQLVKADFCVNVEQWLGSSQNKFSAPITESPGSEIHSKSNVNSNKVKQQKTLLDQKDWDNIETLNEPESHIAEKYGKIPNTMDLEPYAFEKDNFSAENPRRSSRHKDRPNSKCERSSKNICPDKDVINDFVEKNEICCVGLTNNSKTSMQSNWKNIKKIKKHLVKKTDRDIKKLNISIEMCKKNNSVTCKPIINAINSPINNTPYLVEEPNTPANKENQEKSSNELLPKNPQQNTIKPAISHQYEHKNDIFRYIPSSSLVSQYPENLPEVNLDPQKHSENVTTENMLLLKNRSLKVFSPDSQQKDTSVTNPMKIKSISDETGSANSESVQPKARVPFILKGNLYRETDYQNNVKRVEVISSDVRNSKDDGINIVIESGNMSARITVTKKDGCLMVSGTRVEKAIQTTANVEASVSIVNSQDKKTNQTETFTDAKKVSDVADITSQKSGLNKETAVTQRSLKTVKVRSDQITTQTDSKKATADAETVSAGNKITDTIEQELARDMDDIDIFNSGTVPILQDNNNDAVLHSVKTTSEILTCFGMSNNINRNRKRDGAPIANQLRKKSKPTNSMDEQPNIGPANQVASDSEQMNYDEIIGQVFENIDNDINEYNIQKSQTSLKNQRTQVLKKKLNIPEPPSSKTKAHANNEINTKNMNNKYSENVFSMYDKGTQNTVKDMELDAVVDSVPVCITNTREKIAKLLTPDIGKDFNENDEAMNEDGYDSEMINVFTPKTQNVLNEDSDIVEATPQKPKLSVQFSKSASIQEQNESKIINKTNPSLVASKKMLALLDTRNKLSSSVPSQVDEARSQTFAERTPLTINRFSDDIKHKSTPMSTVVRKSLNFNQKYSPDCAHKDTLLSDEGNITTPGRSSLDKLNMEKAFEKTPTPMRRSINMRTKTPRQFTVACSCLQNYQINEVKDLCRDNKWVYSDKYIPELTHLIVAVDENNCGQRSVKFMRALAAGKWMLSFDWILECIKHKRVVNEEPFEVLDNTGAKGPHLSRISKTKLFDGMTFYCHPPFSILQLNDLQELLISAGGKVAKSIQDVSVADRNDVRMLLAEMEHTEDNKFMYMALSEKIVPVNFEWVLNSLGCYQLLSIKDLLLCPDTLLPPLPWPSQLLDPSTEDISDS